MKILVTGALGFIGGSLARVAVAKGHEVVGVARRSAPAPFALRTLELGEPLTALLDEVRPDVLFHGAGTASVGASMTTPAEDFEKSVGTWRSVLESVRRSQARPVLLYPSSAAVYGNPATLPVREDSALAPISPYGFHKVVGETLGREYASCFGLDVAVVRLFSVFGPAQRRLLLWEIYQQLVGSAEAVVLQGTGRETRDFLHVDDVAGAALSLAKSWTRGGRFEVVNVASGEEIDVLGAARAISELTTPKRIECRGIERPGDPRNWRADVTRLEALIGAERPRRPFADALAECVQRWRDESAT